MNIGKLIAKAAIGVASVATAITGGGAGNHGSQYKSYREVERKEQQERIRRNSTRKPSVATNPAITARSNGGGQIEARFFPRKEPRFLLGCRGCRFFHIIIPVFSMQPATTRRHVPKY